LKTDLGTNLFLQLFEAPTQINSAFNNNAAVNLSVAALTVKELQPNGVDERL
jgi:hypothetical protein